jgi:cold shock CspA family protein
MREGGVINRVYKHGYGFITRDSDPEGDGAYFHASDIMTEGGFDQLLAGVKVTFEIVEDDKGPRATRVQEDGKALKKRGRDARVEAQRRHRDR